MRRALITFLVGLVGCATGDAGARETLQPVQEVASGCFVALAEGTPVAMDFVHPQSRVSGQELGAKLAGRHVSENVWLPWWSAAPIEPDPLGPLTIEIAPSAAYDAGPYLQLGVELRVADASGAVILEQQARFNVYERDRAVASIDFEDVALAKRLGLPQAAAAGMQADPFQLHINWIDAELTAFLASTRAGNACELSQSKPKPKPERTTCEAGAGLLVMDDDTVTEQLDLRAKLVSGFAPLDAIAELQREPIEIEWPDGTVSRLHVAYEPDGHACVTEGEIYVRLGKHDTAKTNGYKVVVPLHATLRSEDGRLNARLRGFAETRVAHDLSWDGHVDAALGFRALSRLAEHELPGFEVPHDRFVLLSGWLRAPMPDSHVPRLSLTTCELYPGVPPFPAVDESASNRLSCFCTGRQDVEAFIRPSGAPVR